jgi:ATP-binding protein involved in chromosome partitioning
MDFFLQGSQPLEWDGAGAEGATVRSAMEQAALADLLGQTEWGDLDALVVDLPPGADRLPAFSSFLPGGLGEALAVTIPTEVATLAVERSLRRALDVGIPAIGIVENLGSSVCIKCGEEGPLYHEVSIDNLARNCALDIVARIPFDPALSAAGDRGDPFLEGPGGESPAGRALRGLAERVAGYERPGPEGESW